MKLPTFVSIVLLVLAACSKSSEEPTSAELYAEARGYAGDQIACQQDTDCCVVFDHCLASGYIVSATDQSTVRSLLDQAAASLSVECAGCMTPAVQVVCGQDGFCTGEPIYCTQTDPFDLHATSDHCGSLTLPPDCDGVGAGGTGGAGGAGGAGGGQFHAPPGSSPKIIDC